VTAPRESVEELRRRVATTLHLALRDPHAGAAPGEWEARVQQLADWVHQEYWPHLAADRKAS
jgi:hypothetical protein